MPSRNKLVVRVPGALLAFKLPNGLYGACQVLGPEPERRWMVGALAGIWSTLPTADQCASAGPMRQIRFSFGGRLAKVSLPAKPPPAFIPIGDAAVHPTWGPVHVPPYTLGSEWTRISDAVWMEWRWAHDREALVAEVKARTERRMKKFEESMAAERAKWSALSLEDLAKSKPFSGWSRLWGASGARRANAIFQKAATSLIGCNGDGRHALELMIKDFNVLEKASSCIETDEREEIYLRGMDLATRVGLAGEWKEIFGQLRDW